MLKLGVRVINGQTARVTVFLIGVEVMLTFDTGIWHLNFSTPCL
jgi:hypothetical protein